MRNYSKALAMMAMLGAGIGEIGRPDPVVAKPKRLEPVHPKGHKPFLIDGVEVWALNRRNAEKRAAKTGHL
jgi:hypothetical protein